MKELNIFILFVVLSGIITVNCSFQTEIFSLLNKNYEGKNLIISPFSIFQILSLTSNSANDKTLEAMLAALRIENLDTLNEINYELLKIFNKFKTVEVANAVMPIFTPASNFLEIANNYNSTVETLKSAEQVNNWCNIKTHGKIPKIIDNLDSDTVMILLNAIYFKGEWLYSFEKELTKKKSFYNFNKEEENINMMTQTEHFRYYEDNQIQMIELPFIKDRISAIVILPNKNLDINEYINSFNANDDFENELNEIINNKLESCKVKLELPKFEVNFGELLNDVLCDMGMKIAFTNKADFSGLIEGKENIGLKIGKVIHKTFLKIDELGAEAAAVTGITVDGMALPVEEKIYDMIVNRPFLFILRDRLLPKNNDIMFIAKIEEIKN